MRQMPSLSLTPNLIVAISSFASSDSRHFFVNPICLIISWVLWHINILVLVLYSFVSTPQWGAADAEIKVPSGENTALKCSPFGAWSRSVYSHTCYAYCQRFLSCLFLPFWSIHFHFSKTSPDFPCVGCG